MIERISTCYAPNEEFLVLLLDEMLRRNLLEARALAIFLTNKEGLLPVFAGLQSDHKSFSSMSSSIYQLYEMTMDRSLDYVRAAIYARKELGDDMVLDESLNLTPCNFPDEDEREIVKEDLTEQPVEHDDAENNLDDDLDERRTRRRLNEAQEFAENEFQAAENTVDNISNRLWAADEAVKSSVRNCRDVYASLFKYFELVGKLENGGSSVSSRDLLRNASQSLALRLKRNFEGAQNALSKELNQKVVIV